VNANSFVPSLEKALAPPREEGTITNDQCSIGNVQCLLTKGKFLTTIIDH